MKKAEYREGFGGLWLVVQKTNDEDRIVNSCIEMLDAKARARELIEENPRHPVHIYEAHSKATVGEINVDFKRA